MIEQQHAVEVVEFVLDQAGGQLVGLPVHLVAVDVEPPHVHLLGAEDLEVQPGDRQAPLVEKPLAVRLDDLRVDQGSGAAVIAQVVDEEALFDAHLGGGQAQPRCGVHRLGHVHRQANQAFVDVGDHLCALAQYRVADDADA